jgi:hypothetical protein
MIQLEGTIELGPAGGSLTDCSAEVFGVALIERRNTSRRRGTFSDATETERPGSYSGEMRIMFEDTLDPSTSLAHQIIATALRSDSGLMDFTVKFKSAALGPDNPTYSGTVAVTEVQTGGEVGEELEQEQRFPFNTAMTIATT